MTRRCSHCNHNGHNLRTCANRGVKLFGVRITDGSSIRKSASMGSLSLLAGSSGGASPAEGPEAGGAVVDGYASEDFVPGSSSNCRERKKGTPWTEKEHRMFLLGLKNLGKGDWRGISRNYVVTRTPTQVASHAQKYFIRQTSMTKRKRRSSLFDIVPDELIRSVEPQISKVICQEDELQSSHLLPQPPTLDEECESMDSSNSTIAETAAPQSKALQCSYYPVIIPANYCSPYVQFPLPLWSGYEADTSEQHTHEIVKPTAIHFKTPIDVDELVGISKLSIGDHAREASAPSIDLHAGSKRQSAFHASAPTRAPS